MHILDLSSSVSKGERICDLPFISAWLVTTNATFLSSLWVKRVKKLEGRGILPLVVESFGETEGGVVFKTRKINETENKELWENF